MAGHWVVLLPLCSVCTGSGKDCFPKLIDHMGELQSTFAIRFSCAIQFCNTELRQTEGSIVSLLSCLSFGIRHKCIYPMPFPEADGAFIGTDDKVELHGAKTGSGSPDEGIAAHGTCHAASHCKRGGHIPAVANMRAATLLIGAQNLGAKDDTVVLGNEYRVTSSVPVRESFFARKRTRQRVRFARPDHRLKNGPDANIILGFGLPDRSYFCSLFM